MTSSSSSGWNRQPEAPATQQQKAPSTHPNPMMEHENVALTVLRDMPVPHVIAQEDVPGGGRVMHIAVPKGFTVQAIDNEASLASPRVLKGTAALTSLESFLDYVKRHAEPATVVWADFDPAKNKLAFRAVFDEHANFGSATRPGWRRHAATFTPELSKEWLIWTGSNGPEKNKGQLEFANFIEDNADDIAAGEGLPSSIQMLEMALNFEASQDKRVKSTVRLQSGGVELEYVNTDDAETVMKMRMFERFQLGIPVFRDDKSGFAVLAKLRYRVSSGKVTFWYELRRPDKVHKVAAEDLIKRVGEGIGPMVPLLMGTFA
jgi:uncharacterized protein YfdQ (DUF2303 family)